MNLGIVGSGRLGSALGRRLIGAGHSVVFALRRDAAATQAVAQGLGATVTAAEELPALCELMVLATPWAGTESAVRSLGDCRGKVLWDCTNPLKPDFSGLVLGTDTSGGEQVARWATNARVVKAVPPFAELLASAERRIGGQRSGVFVCGDDAAARAEVSALLAQIEADPVDCGALDFARCTEPMGLLLVRLAYGQGLGARIGLTLLRES